MSPPRYQSGCQIRRSAELSIVARRTHVYSYVMHVVIAARRGGGVEGGVEAGGRFEEGEDAEAEDFVMG